MPLVRLFAGRAGPGISPSEPTGSPRSVQERGIIRINRSIGALALLALLGILAGQIRGRDSSEPAPEDRGGAPRRIVSLVPAATEILFALGASDRLVGRSHWGVYPPGAREVPDVGDGMRPSLEVVLARSPDLVVLYEGEANREVAGRLDELDVPMLRLEHDTLADLRRNIGLLGALVDCRAGARHLTARIESGLAAVALVVQGQTPIRVYYDAWEDPPITIGRGSFLDSLITIAGGANVFGDLAESAPRVSLEAILHRRPDQILMTVPRVALDAVPDLQDRPGWREIVASASGRISVLDRDLMGRLGPRVPEAAASIARALHPGLALPSLAEPAVECGG